MPQMCIRDRENSLKLSLAIQSDDQVNHAPIALTPIGNAIILQIGVINLFAGIRQIALKILPIFVFIGKIPQNPFIQQRHHLLVIRRGNVIEGIDDIRQRIGIGGIGKIRVR